MPNTQIKISNKPTTSSKTKAKRCSAAYPKKK
nr:MAG TPA: hypothetical protein [Inoviridae sp.]